MRKSDLKNSTKRRSADFKSDIDVQFNNNKFSALGWNFRFETAEVKNYYLLETFRS